MSIHRNANPFSYSPLPTNGTSSSGSRNPSLGDTVRSAIQAVVPGFGSTPQALAASLKRSFQIELRPDGRKSVTWMPASVGGSTSSANLTGAVAEFYARASGTLKQARMELEKLEPLCRADASDCCDDIRAILKLKLGEIEDALKVAGGPCQKWVDDIFIALLGSEPDGGLVGRLTARFTDSDDEADSNNATLCEQEERRTARIALFRGTLEGLRVEWNRFVRSFLSGGGSLTLRAGRLRVRLHIIAEANATIRRGLCEAGYSEAQLEVAEFGEPTVGAGAQSEVKGKGQESASRRRGVGEGDASAAREEQATTDELHVGCALTRIEHFALRTAPELLQQPCESGLIALSADACVLVKLSQRLERWIRVKLKTSAGDEDDPDCSQAGRKGTGSSWRAGDDSPCLEDTISAARVLSDQLFAFEKDIAELFPTAASTRS